MSNPTELPDLDKLSAEALECLHTLQYLLSGPEKQLVLAELARRAQPEGEAPQADAGDLPLDVEFKQLADKILQATTNGTRLDALRSMAVLFDKQAEQNVPAATFSPLCGAQHAASGKEDGPLSAKMHDVVAELREFGGNPGYSHGDYADTMRKAANTIEALRAQFYHWGPGLAAQQAAAPADCSGTPSSCPDNEGYGCHCSAPGTPEAPTGSIGDLTEFHVLLNWYDNEASYGLINEGRNKLTEYIDKWADRRAAQLDVGQEGSSK